MGKEKIKPSLFLFDSLLTDEFVQVSFRPTQKVEVYVAQQTCKW